MDLTLYTARSGQPEKGLLAIEKIMLAYCVLTTAMLLALSGRIGAIADPLGHRIAFVIITFALWQAYKAYPCRALYIGRTFFQLGLLGYWYPDIYHFAKVMPNTDHWFAAIDQWMWGCQPALEFSHCLSGPVWNEIFNMGYFSYYIMIFLVAVWATVKSFDKFEFTTVVTLTAFMLYYLIFICLQSAGPQFYYPVIGADNVEAGIFPAVGNYFEHHAELHHAASPTGLFSQLVLNAQGSEKPIAAFPSSHVGLSSILMWLALRLSRKLAAFMLPFYIILCLSTVYIGAHYAIDVLGGWISAVIIYNLSKLIYRKTQPANR